MKPWRERLQEPLTLDVRRLARSWQACAVGEQHKLHPEIVRYYPNHKCGPVDAVLSELGVQFYRVVREEVPERADRILDQIEDRVLELKRERGAR